MRESLAESCTNKQRRLDRKSHRKTAIRPSDAYTWPVFGIVRLLVKTEEERRYKTYRRAKEDLMAHTGGSKVHFGLALLPSGGMAGTVQVGF